MARKTKEEAQKTRESILLAAVDEFYDKGYAQSSLESIAARAGVTRGAVYWHFKNKCDMFSALHEQMHTGLMASTFEHDPATLDSPLATLAENVTKTMMSHHLCPSSAKVMAIFTLKCDYAGDMAAFLEEQNAKKAQALDKTTAYFDAALARGEIRTGLEPRILAISLFCYICGLSTEILQNPTLFDYQKKLPELITLYFNAMKP